MAAQSSRPQANNSPERPGRLCKVRFEGASSSSSSPRRQQNDWARSKWRRLGRLTLLGQARKDKAQPIQQVPMPTFATLATSEEESSSNSTPNLTEHRLSMQAEMAATTAKSQSQTATSYVPIHSSSASTSPAGLNNEEKQSHKKGRQRAASAGRSCLFGVLHVETGARLFLLFYIFLSACGVLLGSVATMVWILVPLVVIPLAAFSLSRHASKYLYPFLIVSLINSLVALLMVLIVGSFSLLCFDQLKAHFAQSMAALPSGLFPSSSLTTLCCALTMALSLGLCLFFFWQSLVIFSCINHFDLLAQQQQQIQQQMAKEPRAMQASIPLDQRQVSAPAMSRQLECSKCISEIRQLGQFTTDPRPPPPANVQ